MRSYRPSELFDSSGRLVPEIARLAPRDYRRMSDNPNANGGLLLRDLDLPAFRDYAVTVPAPGTVEAENTRVLGTWLRDVIKRNPSTFRLLGPDETASNRLGPVFEATGRAFDGEIIPGDNQLTPDGRVMEVLSEHLCQGWLEGYLLTGRHGLFNCYEAFIHIIDSMFNQHAKWLKTTRSIPWRRPVASLNYLLSSLVWRGPQRVLAPGPGVHRPRGEQEGGGHPRLPAAGRQHAAVGRRSLPPVQALRERDRGGQATAGAMAVHDRRHHPLHPRRGDLGVGLVRRRPQHATGRRDGLLRQNFPDIKIRVVNVVDLMTIQPASEHPHGLTDADFDSIFTTDKPVIFAYHGYPWLIHRLTYRHTNHPNFHVRGYKEEGTTTTPFDMTVLNDLDRFHLAGDVVDRVERLRPVSGHFKQMLRNKLVDHKQYICEHGDDMPEIRDWKWPY